MKRKEEEVQEREKWNGHMIGSALDEPDDRLIRRLFPLSVNK